MKFIRHVDEKNYFDYMDKNDTNIIIVTAKKSKQEKMSITIIANKNFPLILLISFDIQTLTIKCLHESNSYYATNNQYENNINMSLN